MLPSYVFSYFFYLYILHVHLYTCLLMCAKRLYKSVLHVRVIGIALFMGKKFAADSIFFCVWFVFFIFMRCNNLNFALHFNFHYSSQEFETIQ